MVTAAVPLQVGDEGAVEPIPRGHKIATQPIAKGEAVRKYAAADRLCRARTSPAGAHVHTHNLEFRAVDTAYEFGTDLRPVPPATRRDTFMGYRRANGRVGTRNYIAVLTT